MLADAVCYVGSHEHTRGDDVLRVPPPSPRCIGGVSKSFRAGLLPTQRRKVWSQCTGPCWGHHLLSGPLPSLWLPGLVIHAAASLRLHSDQVWRSTCKGPVTPASRDASSPGPSSAATRGTHRPSTQPSTDTDHGDIWNRRPGGNVCEERVTFGREQNRKHVGGWREGLFHLFREAGWPPGAAGTVKTLLRTGDRGWGQESAPRTHL